jgi:hypothetical protein
MDGIEKELDRDELIALVLELREANARLREQNERLQQQIQNLQRQIDELRKQSPTKRLDQPYSCRAEEQRQAKKQGKRRQKQQSERRGRRETQEKLDQADRAEIVLPEGFAIDECAWVRERPVWRIENGQAVRIAYDLYRGPGGEMPTIPGVLPRSEYGLEIHVAVAFLVHIVCLSMDKVCALLKFFWKLDLSKSQADALLNQLSREWEAEFEALCQLLAISAVVHADETSWSINSVWAFLSEKVRILVFGCRKDAGTLTTLLSKETFNGILVSDDAAVYRDFSTAQKCWAHLLRKAIRLTLLEPENDEYRRFLDGLLEVYRTACRFSKDKRLSEAGRLRKVDELSDMMCELCGDRFADESEPTTDAEKDYFNLVHELVRLLGDRELFTFVVHPEAPGTNNEAERTLRDPAKDRRTGRTSKTLRGARRRTILASVLESLRLHLAEFTLDHVLQEVTARVTRKAGGLFQQMADSCGLDPPAASSLDALLPQPIS